MDRVRNLDRFQKCILILLAVMLVVFSVLYPLISSRRGFEYMECILLPEYDSGSTVYSGKINGQEATFTVSEDKSVTFQYGNMSYGPYTAKLDPSATPDDKEYMTGVEIREGDEVFFRGGVIRSGKNLMLFDENGDINGFTFYITSSNGTVMDGDGNVVDTRAPSPSTILSLMEGPELTSKGEWIAWFLGVIISIATAVSILFADELFRWNLAFQIRNADRAEPSDLELAGRYISWTLFPIMALVIYIMGLR